MLFIRTINAEKVRKYCIDCNYYTHGNNEEYCKMLEMCDHYDNKEATDEDIIAIGRDIYAHSDMTEFEESGGTFEDFMWGILNKCIRWEVIPDNMIRRENI